MDNIVVSNGIYRSAKESDNGYTIYRFLNGERCELPNEIKNILPYDIESINVSPNNVYHSIFSIGQLWIIYYQRDFYRMSISNYSSECYEISYLSKIKDTEYEFIIESLKNFNQEVSDKVYEFYCSQIN